MFCEIVHEHGIRQKVIVRPRDGVRGGKFLLAAERSNLVREAGHCVQTGHSYPVRDASILRRILIPVCIREGSVRKTVLIGERVKVVLPVVRVAPRVRWIIGKLQ